MLLLGAMHARFPGLSATPAMLFGLRLPSACRCSLGFFALDDRSIIPVAADCRSSWDGGVLGTTEAVSHARASTRATADCAAIPALDDIFGSYLTAELDATAAGAEASARWRLGHIGEPLPAGTALFGVSTLRADALPPAGDVLPPAGDDWRS
jgi:hypothetical protein